MKIVIASDHAGFDLKEKIKDFLTQQGYEVIDAGCNSAESVDYPDFGIKAAEYVRDGKADKGIVVCGTGIGISISANKVNNIRAALCHNTETARLAVEHNNANIIAIGSRITDHDYAVEIIKTYLASKFEGGRHQNRIDKISDYENC